MEHEGNECAEKKRALCKWLRMKFSAGCIELPPAEASGCYEYPIQTLDVCFQSLEQRDGLCFTNEYSDEVWV